MTRFGSRLSLDDGSELDALTELPPGIRLVQFRRRLTDERFRHLASLLEGRADTGLRVYSSPDVTDLEFLRLFPDLRSFQVDGLWDRLTSLDGLGHLSPALESLGIGATRRPMSLAILERFGALQALAIEGRHRDMEVIGSLRSLESLMLRSVTLPDLSLLTSLDRLRSLDIKLGGTSNLGLLPRVGRLEDLELWQIRGLSDLSAIGETVGLTRLFLQSLAQVRTLPDLSRLTELRTVTLHTMKGIRDLAPLAQAPGLESLSLIAMGNLRPEDLRPLVGHPTLRRGHWNIGSLRKTYEAHDIVPIAPEPYGYADWRAGVPYRQIRAAFTAALQVGLREVDGRMVIDPVRAARRRPTPEANG